MASGVHGGLRMRPVNQGGRVQVRLGLLCEPASVTLTLAEEMPALTAAH